ncbi:MAG: aldehyde dehydrogenase family protein [Gammaproteobacteria bacterium]|nr:aldehyde dehydrogenase family protein [Gammaproteobacteria bacterium]
MRDKLFIDGRWVSPIKGGTLPVINPANEVLLHQAPGATQEDINAAVEAASAASSSWRKTTGKERAVFLRAISEGISKRRDALARLEVLDNGKPLPEALWDIDDAAGCFAFYADLAEDLDHLQNDFLPVPDERFDCRVRYEPIGVAGQIIPWNYPLLMASWKVAPALAAGCTMVLKPSELTPLTALELAAISEEAGLPKGVLNVVSGYGPEAGAPLAAHPKVRKLAFTGSVPTGSRVMLAAAQDIKNVSLELGGKSPFIVFDDADIEAAVEWVMFGIFWNQGQVCSATSRLLVQRGIASRLSERLAEESQRITIGNGLAPDILLGPLVSEGQYQKVTRFVEQGRSEGARLIAGGKRPAHLSKGYFLEPTIFVDVPRNSVLWREEIFGPVLCMNTFASEEEAIHEANDSEFGLAAAVMSQDLARCDRVAAALDAGIVWINCSQPTFTQAPWGGMKKSGIGRELGKWGLDNYLEVKQVTRYTSPKPWGWYMK